MPKIIPAALAAHLAGAVTTLATCLEITRRDARVLRFTDHDADLRVAGETYRAAAGYSASALTSTAELAVGRADLSGPLLAVEGIEAEAVRAGLFDGAAVRLFRVNWQAPDDGVEELLRGWLGEIELDGAGGYTAELRDLRQALKANICEITSRGCRAQLFDARCGVPRRPPVWTAQAAVSVPAPGDARSGSLIRPSLQNGAYFRCTTAGTTGATEPAWDPTPGATTADGSALWTAIRPYSQDGSVTAAPDRKTLSAGAIAVAPDWWQHGTLVWTSGANAGLRSEVAADSGAGALTLKLATVFPIALGDGFEVDVACNKLLNQDAAGAAAGHCVNRFDNALNFRGEPYFPGTNRGLQTPSSR